MKILLKYLFYCIFLICSANAEEKDDLVELVYVEYEQIIKDFMESIYSIKDEESAIESAKEIGIINNRIKILNLLVSNLSDHDALSDEKYEILKRKIIYTSQKKYFKQIFKCHQYLLSQRDMKYFPDVFEKSLLEHEKIGRKFEGLFSK